MWAPVSSAAAAAPVAVGPAVFEAFLAALFFAGLFLAAAFFAAFFAGAFLAAVFLAAAFFAVFLAAFFAAVFSVDASVPVTSDPDGVSAGGFPSAFCPAAVSSAVFFATMAAAPSHIVILLANRAGTINRPQPRGNGARRPFRPSPCPVVARLHPLFPAPRPVIRPRDTPGRPRTPAENSVRPRLAIRVTPGGRVKPVGRRPYGPVHWAQREAWMGRVASYAASSDPGTVGARGRARREDHPGAAGRKPRTLGAPPGPGH